MRVCMYAEREREREIWGLIGFSFINNLEFRSIVIFGFDLEIDLGWSTLEIGLGLILDLIWRIIWALILELLILFELSF